MGAQDWRSYPQLDRLLYKKAHNMLLHECTIIFLGHVFGEPEIINERLEPGIW